MTAWVLAGNLCLKQAAGEARITTDAEIQFHEETNFSSTGGLKRLPNRAPAPSRGSRFPIMIALRSIIVPATVILASSAFGAKFDEMDYGRFLTASYYTQETKAADGKVIKPQSSLCDQAWK
jgi:hypothetical protein